MRQQLAAGDSAAAEGDFTQAELNLAKSAGCLPLSLGPLVLRSETAALYALSILHHELQSHGRIATLRTEKQAMSLRGNISSASGVAASAKAAVPPTMN